MRKLALLLMATIFSLNVWSQTMYEKYNSYQNRYEYFDTYGNMIGYKTYNSLTKTWAYYDLKQRNNDMNLSETAKYVGTVQAQLQARYDYNYNRLTNSIEALVHKVSTSPYSDFVKRKSIQDFSDKAVKQVEQKVQMTDNSDVTRAITYLNNTMDYLVGFYREQENKSKN